MKTINFKPNNPFKVSPTFWIDKTLNYDFIVFQEIVLCRCLKSISLTQIAAVLELADIASLKRKIRDGNILGITEYI